MCGTVEHALPSCNISYNMLSPINVCNMYDYKTCLLLSVYVFEQVHRTVEHVMPVEHALPDQTQISPQQPNRLTSSCAYSQREGAGEEWQWRQHDCGWTLAWIETCMAQSWPHPAAHEEAAHTHATKQERCYCCRVSTWPGDTYSHSSVEGTSNNMIPSQLRVVHPYLQPTKQLPCMLCLKCIKYMPQVAWL